MADFSRRGFLFAGAAATTAGLLLPGVLRRGFAAGPGTARNVIIVQATGGWDVTYTIDPKPDLQSVDAPAGTMKAYGDFPVFVDPSRPTVEQFFDQRGDIAAVVNGISVRSIAHPECRKRMLTGSQSDKAADFGAMAGAALGNDLPVPYLILGGTAFAGEHAASSGRVGATKQIKVLLDPTEAYDPLPEAPSHPRYVPNSDDEAAIRRYVEARASRFKATRGARGYNRSRIEDFVGSLERGDRLKTFNDELGERGFALDFQSQLQVAADALQQGMSRAVMVDTTFSWDTHDNNAQQNTRHEQLYQGLTLLLDDLEARSGAKTGATLLDETMVVVISEMTRTPKLNGEAGKDHWPVASSLLLGAGIRGGSLSGGTNDLVESQFVDLATGAVDSGGALLDTKNFVAGVLAAAGADTSASMPTVEPLLGFVA